MRVDWFAIVEKLYEVGGRKTFHVSELAEIAEQLGTLPLGEDKDSFAKQVSQFLARNVKSKTPQFSKVKNKAGGFRKGVYRIRPQKTMPLTPVEGPKVSTGYTGKAGEFAVMSELLFRGFNSSVMTVDEGIDIIAHKNNRYFHIQVKTANCIDGKPYAATIRSSALKHGGDVFYVLVLRRPTQLRIYNEFVILSSLDIRRWIGEKLLKDGANISLRISLDKSKYILNSSIDVTSHVNDFDVIC